VFQDGSVNQFVLVIVDAVNNRVIDLKTCRFSNWILKCDKLLGSGDDKDPDVSLSRR
jgi:hypothetical protein